VTWILNNKTLTTFDCVSQKKYSCIWEANLGEHDLTARVKIDNQNLETIKKFLAHKTEKKIISDYKIDKSIVAGIRLQSSTLLWEYSVYKQCETLRKQFKI